MTKKSPMAKFTLKDFYKMYPTDDACLDYLRNEFYPEVIKCQHCGRDAKFYQITKRKLTVADYCGYQILSSRQALIFHKSPTPLTVWFYVIYLMSQTRGGISAKQIQRETGVTYKCAWRMCKQVRSMLFEDYDKFSGDVEMDKSYFGGEKRTSISASERRTIRAEALKPRRLYLE